MVHTNSYAAVSRLVSPFIVRLINLTVPSQIRFHVFVCRSEFRLLQKPE